MTNIFEYSNIFDPNIYSDIRSYRNFNTNIFGYSFVSKMFIRIYSDIRSYHFLDTNIFGYSFVSKSIRMSHSDAPVRTVVDVPCLPIFTLLAALDFPTVDFFSLDVEGAELGILQTIPWDQVINIF